MSFNTFITINLKDKVTKALKKVQKSINKVKRVEGTFEVNTRAIDRATQKIRKFNNTTLNLKVKASSRNLIQLENSLNKIRNRSVIVNVKTNTKAFNELENKFKTISNKTIKIKANGDFKAIQQVAKNLNHLKNKTVKINTIGDLRGLREVSNRVSRLRDKALRIRARVDMDGIREDRSRIKLLLNNIKVRVKVDKEDFKNQVLKLSGAVVATAIPVKTGMDYETRMVEPYKVTPKEWDFNKNIRPIIEKIYKGTPSSLKAITELAKEGIATGKLKVDVAKGDYTEVEEFIQLASEAKVAFEVADDALKKTINASLSKLGYSIKDTRTLFDMLNYSTLISPSKMVDMLNVLGRTAGNLRVFKMNEIATLINFAVEKGVSPELTASSLNAIVKRTQAIDYAKIQTMKRRLQMSIGTNPIAEVLGEKYITTFQKKNGKINFKKIRKAVKAGTITQAQAHKIRELYYKNNDDIAPVIKQLEALGNPAEAFDRGEGFQYLYKVLSIAKGIKNANIRMNFLKGIFGVGEASNLAQNFLNDLDTLKKRLDLITNDKRRFDSVRREYNIVMSTANASMQRLKNNIAMVAIEMSKPLLKPLKLFFDFLSDNLTILTNFMQKNKHITQTILLIAGGVLSLGVAFLAFKGIVLATGFILGGFASAMGILLSPIGLVVAGITLIISKWESFKRGFTATFNFTMFNQLKASLIELWNIIQPIITPIINFFRSVAIAIGLINDNTNKTNESFSILGTIIQIVGGIIGMVLNGVIWIIQQVINVVNYLATIVSNVFTFFADKVNFVIDKVVSLYNWLVSIFDLGGKLGGLVDKAKSIGNSIADKAGSAWQSTKEFFGFGDNKGNSNNSQKKLNSQVGDIKVPTLNHTSKSEVTLKIADEDKKRVQAVQTVGNVKIK
jgi:hypothetical protein